MFEIYTNPAEAKKVIEERRADKNLLAIVKEIVGDIPVPLQSGPRAVLARQVATPNFESLHFVTKSEEVGLEPIWLEFKNDRFCTNNKEKVALGKTTFSHGVGRSGGPKTSVHKMVDLQGQDNKMLREVVMKDGRALVEVHEKMFQLALPGAEKFEMSTWINGDGAGEYYKRFLALFICHGVLFENFADKGNENFFCRRIVLSAIEKLKDETGFGPVIVRLLEDSGNSKWNWYPGYLEEIAK